MTDILHLGDIHIRDGENLDDTIRCLDFVARLASDEHVELMLIPGDVFDRASTPRERAVFADWLRTSIDCDVVICRGNHDRPADLVPFALHPNVTVLERPEIIEAAGVNVIVLPWPERAQLAEIGLTGENGLQAAQAALGDLVRSMVAMADRRAPLVIMGHLAVAGAVASSGQPLIGREIEAVLGDLEDLGAAYIALNHIHKHQEPSDRIVYAGSLTRQDFGEEAEPKGVVLVHIDDEDTSWRFVQVPARRWLTIEAHVKAPGEVCEDMAGELGLPDISDANVRYRYHCRADEAHLFDHAEIERRFAEAHTLKIVAQIDRGTRVRSAEVAEAKSMADKLRAWGAVTSTEITPSLLAKLETLQQEEANHA